MNYIKKILIEKGVIKPTYKELRKKIITLFTLLDIVGAVVTLAAGTVLRTVFDFPDATLIYLLEGAVITAIILQFTVEIRTMDKCYNYINEQISKNPQGVNFADLPLFCQYVISEDGLIRDVLFTIFVIKEDNF